MWKKIHLHDTVLMLPYNFTNAFWDIWVFMLETMEHDLFDIKSK
jgi:hypothetical protein